MKDDAVIKDNEAVYLINEQTYLHLRENIEGIGYEVFEKESPLPVEEGQIPREVLGDSQRRIEAAREYYLAEHFDDPVVKIQNVAVTTLEKFRSGVRKRRTLDPHSLPDDDVRFIDPRYNELFRVPDGSMVQLKFPNGRQWEKCLHLSQPGGICAKTCGPRRNTVISDEAVPAKRAGLLSAYAAEAGCRPCAPLCIHALSGKAEHCSVY